MEYFKLEPDLVQAIQQTMYKHCGFYLYWNKQVESYVHSIATRKDFEYQGLLNFHIEKLRENGVLDLLSARHLEPVSKSKDYLCSNVQVNL